MEKMKKLEETEQELWARFGQLSAQQEILTNQIRTVIEQKNKTYTKIMELRQKKQEKLEQERLENENKSKKK